jgi:anaphase-promoting complex subunit 5
MALCALARYLGTSRPFDAEASEPRVREPPPSCVRNLSESDWRLLSLVLMEEATASEGRREPSMRAFHATLDRLSQARGAPPAEAFPPPPDLEAAISSARVARSPGDGTDAPLISDSPAAAAFLARRMAECHALLRDAPPANLADVLVEAVGSLRDVDDLERLFREVEPRSAHAAEMRGDARGELGGWASPVDADSAVGAFVRACVADFAAAPFERACALAQAMDAYRREGHGEYDDAFSRVAETRKNRLASETESPNVSSETLLRADARWDDAEAAAERADAAARRRDDLETDDSETEARFRERVEISLANLASRDGAGAAFAFPPPCDPLAFLERASRPTRTAEATRVRDAMIRADAGEAPRGLRDGSDGVQSAENGSVDVTRDDAVEPGGRFLAHLEYARRREFETAEACLRSHFDAIHPASGLEGLEPLKNEKESTPTHTDAFGFLPPEGLFFGSAGADAAGTATKTGADGQALSRRRLHAAALSLARAHVRAGRADEALKALNETVRVAQQDGDTGALAHAVAALCALSASSAAPVASREGVPAGTAASFALSPAINSDENDFYAGGRETSSFGEARKSTEDHRVLLQRLVVQARALKDPTLLAFADIASARRRAARPAAGAQRAPEARERIGGGAAAGRRGGPAGPGFATAAARARAVCASPPATAAAAARRVEALRHHAALGAAAPVPLFGPASGDAKATGSGEGREERNAANAFYPPPRGLSAEALGDVATSASVAQLAGSASALAAAVWEAHGVAEPARLCALKHLRLDASKCAKRRFAFRKETPQNSDASAAARLEVASVSAAAADTATALAQLARHASREHGPETAADVLDMASRRFPGFGDERGFLVFRKNANSSRRESRVVAPPEASPAASAAAAAAARETRLARLIALESYHEATACVSALAALSPALSCWDPETRVEAFRAQAHVKLVAAGDCVGAHDDAVRCAAAARALGRVRRRGKERRGVAGPGGRVSARARARAGAAARARRRAHRRRRARLDGARAAAAAAAAECLLGLDAGACGAFAAAAAEALDAHAVGLLGKGGLAVRARARLAAGKAALAMRERARVTDEARGGSGSGAAAEDAETDLALAPLASAAAAAEAAGSFALEAEAHYLRALRLNQLGDAKGRNEAARAFRRCERAARRARRGDRVGRATT